jgi:hypothetical protein
VIEKILDRKWKHLDIKKLKVYDKQVHRVRRGDMRIIFIDQGDDISALSIGRRDEDTYKIYNSCELRQLTQIKSIDR